MKSDAHILRRELAQHLRMKDAAHLQALRGKIAHARAERVRMLASARAQCRHAREGLKARQARQRAKFVEEQRAARAAGKERCKSGKKTAGSKYNELAARTALREARTLQRQVRNADRRNVKQRSTIRERSQESDDAVRSNLPPELVPVFNAHRKNFKGSARRSRTEQFLEWAEENPDEIISIQSANAERELAELVREHTAHGRAVRKAGRYRQDPAALRRALAAVPF